jgi:nickel/cobalt transporter (NicO) family protein
VRPVARRGAVLVALVALLVAAGVAQAAAHPLGNFTVNTYSGLRVGPDRLVVDYVVDMAEIPTFQARQTIDTDHDGRVGGPEAARWRDQECLRLAGGVRATLDGQPLPLTVAGSALRFPEGVGGLETVRLECALTAALPAGRASARALAYADTNPQGRVGWREITAVGDHTTLAATDVPPTSTSARLTTYPSDQLGSPLDQRTANLRFRCEAPRRGSGAGSGAGCSGLSRPPAAGAETGAGGMAPVVRGGVDRVTAAFTGLVGERSRSAGFAVVAVLVAVVLGGAHALAPGHGKTVMAAYLVGLRGTLRQAVTIGATVTITHTAGVLLLGVVLSTTRAVASERVYPWLGLASGLLLAAVGVGLLVRARTGHTHSHGPGHSHSHGRDHDHPHGSDHGHPDDRRAAPPLGRRGLVVLGLAGGLVPSPSAVVVLLGGIALGRAWFGVALVLAYGLGMAATLTGVGLLLARLRTRMDRRLHLPAGPVLTRLGRLLPAVSGSVIVLVGVAVAVRGAAGI